MMLTLNDGRAELWQWDTGRTLSVDADCSQVHFSNKVFGRSIDVDVADGVATIPDVLLQTDNDLNVWAFVGTAENGYTKISKTFKVNRRNKPADYVFTPTDQITLQTIQSQIGDLDDLTTEAKDTLVAAINEAARSGGGAGSMDLRVAGGYVQYSTDGGSTWQNLIAVAELKGADGITPTIGQNGNWFLGEEDTGNPSRGVDGATGATGATGQKGADGKSAYAYAVEGGYTGTEAEFAEKLASEALIVHVAESNGTLSADKTYADIRDAILAGTTVLVDYGGVRFPLISMGNSLFFGAIQCNETSVATVIIEITSNDEAHDFSAQIDIPTTLPNPNALTFTGAVTGSYDGSAPLSVEIPSGGGVSGGGGYYEEQTLIEDTEVYTFLIDTEMYNRYTITVYQPGNSVSPSVAFVRGGMRCNYLTDSGTAHETYFFLELVESDSQSNGGTKEVVGNSRRNNNGDANTFQLAGITYVTTEANCILVKGTTLKAGTIISVRCWE